MTQGTFLISIVDFVSISTSFATARSWGVILVKNFSMSDWSCAKSEIWQFAQKFAMLNTFSLTCRWVWYGFLCKIDFMPLLPLSSKTSKTLFFTWSICNCFVGRQRILCRPISLKGSISPSLPLIFDWSTLDLSCSWIWMNSRGSFSNREKMEWPSNKHVRSCRSIFSG